MILAAADPQVAAIAHALKTMQLKVTFRSDYSRTPLLQSCAIAQASAIRLLISDPVGQHLLPAFQKEGVTDDVASSLALVDLKALGLSTMSQAQQFKRCFSDFLASAEGGAIEKPRNHAAPSVAGAAVPSAPAEQSHVANIQPSHAQLSNVPSEFTDQYTAFMLLKSDAPCFCDVVVLRYFTMELLTDPVVAADGFTYSFLSRPRVSLQPAHSVNCC